MVRTLIGKAAFDFVANESVLIKGTYFSAVIVSSLFGAILSGKISRAKILRFWMVLGCIVSIIPLLFSNLSVNALSVVALFLGLSFGIGMPSCLAFFAESVNLGKRGAVSGVILVAINLGAVVLTLLFDNLTIGFGISMIWRIIGLCVVFLLKPTSSKTNKMERVNSFRLILQNRTFILYIIPWLIFCLVDRFERVYSGNFFEQNIFDLALFIEPIVGIIFVLIGGFFADRIGRKRVLIYGFVALGIGYASIGLAPYMDIARYFYIFVDGIAWGIFMVIYMLILWGDFSVSRGIAEKYYTLGSIPFFLSDLVVLFLSPYVEKILGASAYAIFSLAAFFLFLAVIPLMYAPETLPEKKIRERELKQYIDKAKKTKEKYT
jgi:MFS family permease